MNRRLFSLFLGAVIVSGVSPCNARYARGGASTTALPAAVMPAYNNAQANWQNAGVPGGIPNRTTQCGPTISPIGGGADDYTNIQGAINACTPGDYVSLSAGPSITFNGSLSGNTLSANTCSIPLGDVVVGTGVLPGLIVTAAGTCTGGSRTYTVAFSQAGGVASETMTAYVPFSIKVADLPLQITNGITLRGLGCSTYCQSEIVVVDGVLPYQLNAPQCGMSTSSSSACPNGGPSVIQVGPVNPNYNYSWNQCGNVGSTVGTGCGATQLAVDAAQGQTTVQLTSLTNMVAGNWVLIDEASGGGWRTDPMNATTGFGSVWASEDWLNSSATSTVNGVSSAVAHASWSKGLNAGGWDFGGPSVTVTASSTTVTFSYPPVFPVGKPISFSKSLGNITQNTVYYVISGSGTTYTIAATPAGSAITMSATGSLGTVETYPFFANTTGCWHNYCDRPTAEMHKIASVGAGPCPGVNCTITFDDPLTIAFRRSGPISFTGSISGTALTANSCSLTIGEMIGDTAATPAVANGTYITALGTCSGGNETYTVSISQTVASEAMQANVHGAQVYSLIYPNNQGTGSTTIQPTQGAGVENLGISRGPNGGVQFLLCVGCWMKSVDVGGWLSGAVNIDYSARIQVTGSALRYCYDSVNSGAEYPISIEHASTEVLLDNNIVLYGGKGMVARAGGAGSVVAYNYFDDEMYDKYSGIGDYWRDMSANASHWIGPHHVLFEGNWADSLDNDNTHGNSTFITFFRNNGTGLRTPFTDPSLNSAVNDFAGTGTACGNSPSPGTCFANPPTPLRTTGPMSYNYWFSYVGNTLGVSGETTTAHGWSYQGDWSSSRIFMPGWNGGLGAGSGGQDPYIDGVSGSYIFLSGNYDYVTAGINTWAPGYSQTLPNSLYLSSAPAFFSSGASCTYSWPWVTPTSSPYVQTNSCSGSGLPAKARADAGTWFSQP